MNFPQRKIYPFVSRKKPGLSGLGFDPFSAAATIAAGLLKKPSGGGYATQPGTAVTTTVSPTIQTAISPQISPVFQQAFQPSGSPMTAGTTQTMPTAQSATPVGSGTPGFATGMPTAAGMDPSQVPGGWPISAPGGVYTQGQRSFLQKYGMYLAIGGGLIVLAMVMKKRRGSQSRALRTI